MRVLVTGAAGFIGSHVAEHCLSWAWMSRDRRPLGRLYSRMFRTKPRFVKGDLKIRLCRQPSGKAVSYRLRLPLGRMRRRAVALHPR